MLQGSQILVQKQNTRVIPETLVCRILMFVWFAGRVFRGDVGTSRGDGGLEIFQDSLIEEGLLNHVRKKFGSWFGGHVLQLKKLFFVGWGKQVWIVA